MDINWTTEYGSNKDVYSGKIDGIVQFEIHQFKNKLSCFLLFNGALISRDPTLQDAMKKAVDLYKIASQTITNK